MINFIFRKLAYYITYIGNGIIVWKCLSYIVNLFPANKIVDFFALLALVISWVLLNSFTSYYIRKDGRDYYEK
ncbi:hypothetical protein [Clostridium sp.]|uniref:hypothetical protein n=1 Tax=Clostridium sp. TaxID=1506 RepID=UPI002FC9D51A